MRKWRRAIATIMSSVMLIGTAFESIPVRAASVLDDLELPYTVEGYMITGNITLPTKVSNDSNVEITWSCDKPEIIDVNTHELDGNYGANYTQIPAGLVTRPAEDTAVTLTAKATIDDQQYSRNYSVYVKAAPEKSYKEMDEDGDFKAYLYAYFSGDENGKECQQTHFATSDDGLNWQNLNYNRPVIESTLGTKGLRDHFLVRSPEGDHFYLIATDLDASGGQWSQYSTAGSKDIMVWESDDLIHWSDQRAVTIADEYTGCMWAPETLYDEITGEYIVYWSGHDINSDSDTYGKKVVYYVKTRDFYSFTPQKKFVEPEENDGVISGTSDSFIDTTMIEGNDGKFYRVTKYEGVSPTQVFLDVSDYPLGNFSRVTTNLSEKDFLGTEGPGFFRFNKDDREKTGYQYGLMLDGYNGPNAGVGFFPSVIESLDNTESLTFTRLKSGFTMPSGPKHGGIIQLTQEEYEAVNEYYGIHEPEYSEVLPEPVAKYTFEENNLTDIDATFTTGASLTAEADASDRVLYLDGTADSYMEIPMLTDDNGKPLESYTVSFDVRNKTTGNYFNLYIGDGISRSTGTNYLGLKVADTLLASTSSDSVEKKINVSGTSSQDSWKHFDVVVSNRFVQIYEDYSLVGTLKGYIMEDISPEVIRFGFSAWSTDAASKAYYDNVTLYSQALSAAAVLASVPEIAKPDPILKYTFEESDLDSIGATFTTGASLVKDEELGSHVLYLDGTTGSYMEFPALNDESDNPLERFTVSLDINNLTTGNYFNVYIGDGSSASKGTGYLGLKLSDSVLISTSANGTEKKTTVSGANAQEQWRHIDMVVSDGIVKVYADRVLLGMLEGYTMGEINASVFRFGFSAWSADQYSKAYYDNITIYDRALSLAELTADDPSFEKVQLSGKVFHYDFEEISEEGVVTDISGNGNDATVGTVTTTTFGDKTALSTDASSTYVTMPNNISDNLDEYTISMWASPQVRAANIHNKKLFNFGSNMYFVAQGNTSHSYQSWMYQGGISKDFTMNIAPSSVPNSNWNHVLLTQSGDTVSLYVDGVLWGTMETTSKLSDYQSVNNYIGKEFATNLADVKLYDHALSYSQILYDAASVYDTSYEILNYIVNAYVPFETNVFKDDISLLTAEEAADGYTLSWKSSDESIVTNDGKVTRPEEGKAAVTLKATFSLGGQRMVKEYEVIILGNDYYDFQVAVKNKKDVLVQQDMFGLFFEDINYAADGGLYAEMVENRSFETIMHNNNDAATEETYLDSGYAWSAVSGTMEYRTEEPLNDKNQHYLSFHGTSFKNKAYEGMYIEEGKKYKVSFYAKSDSYAGSIQASSQKNDVVGMSGTIASGITNEWKKYEAELTATATVRNSDFIITLSQEGQVDFDMISVFPEDAVCGVFRKDLAEKLKALHPGFLRFPGGCVIEGWDLDNRYQWKNSVGPVEERVQNWNRWATSNRPNYLDYNQTLGLGFYEYFILCEYLDCNAVPVLNAGLSCEYQGKETVPIYEADGVTYTSEFWSYIQDALDLIEFANGDTDTEWGRLRKEMGHEASFNLTMLGIGNEQWELNGNQWYTRYEIFEKEIHKVYPDMKLISTSGPSASGSSFNSAWSWIRNNAAENDSFTYAVDEHYYMSPEWFLANDTRYDGYDRNVKVFAGEYAAHTTLTSDAGKKNNLESAIAEAAFLTGVERNADVVTMASYAPLFARINYVQWAPDMIWFDDKDSYASPNYYVQSMYSNNLGDYTLQSEINNELDKFYQSTSYDAETGDIIIKMVNPYELEQKADIVLDESFGLTGTAQIQLLTGTDPAQYNAINSENNIETITFDIEVEHSFRYIMPAYSFVVMRVHTRANMIDIVDASLEDETLTYDIAVGAEADKSDVYVALYQNHKLLDVKKNQLEGAFSVAAGKEYQIKAMAWEQDTMKPVTDSVQWTVTGGYAGEPDAQYSLLSYTTDGKECYGTWANGTALIGNSLHLAVSADGGETYEALNEGVGVLFAEADYEESNPVNGTAKMLVDPCIFRMADGTYGVIASRSNQSLTTADSKDGSAMIYQSDDLINYNFLGYLPLDNSKVSELNCTYADSVYTISWTDSSGIRKSAVTTDFKKVNDTVEITDSYERPTSNLSTAVGTNVISIDAKTYQQLKRKLMTPKNIGVEKLDDVVVSVGGELQMPKYATAKYSNGSTSDFSVNWDTSTLDLSKQGEYTVSGTIQTTDYNTSLIPNRADPCVLKYEDGYYFVATRDSGGQTVIYIRHADTLKGLATAEEYLIYDGGSNLVWAPELHEVNGTLTIYFATGSVWSEVQSHVMTLEGSDPTNADDWSTPVRITLPDGTYLCTNGISLDMTYFEWEGKSYLAWAQRVIGDSQYGTGSSDILIAEYQPEESMTSVVTTPVTITKPYYAWERSRTPVDEGPYTLVHDNRLCMTIAANATDYSYGIKLLTLKEGGNPLLPEDWHTKGFPILSTANNNAEPGPGHSSFTQDEEGNDVLVYHWGKAGSGRTTTMKRVHYDENGEPILNIHRGTQIRSKYKNVTVKVVVK
ncbi:MAG: family 43 glycosylhydrolase [Lachnospiraceae bacterium]